jgi:hypothetical protein
MFLRPSPGSRNTERTILGMEQILIVVEAAAIACAALALEVQH